MSEMPSASRTIDTPAPESAENYPQVEFGDEAVLNPEWQQDMPEAYSETDNPAENLGPAPENNDTATPEDEPTSEEKNAKEQLEGVKTKMDSFMEEHVDPRARNLREGIDKVRTLGDKAEKKALLLDRREAARVRKTTRLEAKLATIPKGTIRYRRLERKLAKKHIGLNNMRDTRASIDSRIENRPNVRASIETAREKEKYLNRELLRVKKEVAEEKKRRRKDKLEARTTSSEARRAELKAKIKSWESDTIAKFEQRLIEEVKNRMDGKKSNK